MSNMDEISYWVYTKRAPCLFLFDDLFRKQYEEAHCSKTQLNGITCCVGEVPSPKKRKKRKLSILCDDDSVSSKKQQNVYFENSKQKNHTTLGSGKSDAFILDSVNNRVNNVLPQERSKPYKSSTSPKKKNKLITSTPKSATNLKRSLRRTQKTINNNSHLNSSYEIFSPVNVIAGNNVEKSEEEKLVSKLKMSEKNTIKEQGVTNKILDNTVKNKTLLNEQFEDISDVSGFTANYIRSTKIHSQKTSRRNKNRNLRGSQSIQTDNSKMFVCVNKSMNTGVPKTNMLDCSIESSQIINIVTIENNEKHTRVNRSTSLLKFMNRKSNKNGKNNTTENNKDNSKQTNGTDLNISFESNDTSTRYPKRHKNNVKLTMSQEFDSSNDTDKRKQNRNVKKSNDSDRKENPEEKSISRTRSGRSIGLTVRQSDNSVLVLSNLTEQISSGVAINVANPRLSSNDDTKTKRRTSSRNKVAKKTMDKSGKSLGKDSLRDKSGFAACFSDSDDDKPLTSHKYFC